MILPNSSNTIAISSNPIFEPPYFSGIAIPVRPKATN